MIAARDAAITLLALTTGYARATSSTCGWPTSTGGHGPPASCSEDAQPLTVPLTDLLVGTLADYVLDQRPGSPDDHVFLRSVAPRIRLADHAAIHRVITERSVRPGSRT